MWSRNIGYSLFGSGGAAVSAYAGQRCTAGCSGCFACIGLIVMLAGWALMNQYKKKGIDKEHELAERDY